MESRLFRKQSIDRITSPEQLQDYMRVTNPGIWMVLAAVIALLVGLLVSSALATLESSIPVEADVEGNVALVELSMSQKDLVKQGMTLRIGDHDVVLDLIFEDNPDTFCAMGDAEDLPDGKYDAEIVTETISPIKLLIN